MIYIYTLPESHFMVTLGCIGELCVRAVGISGHAAKNSGAQVSSASKTVHLGRFWVDCSGMRGFGLPLMAFLRTDPQSDAIQALLSCPFFCVTSDKEKLDLCQVHWSCRGSLLWTLSVGLCFSPYLHKDMLPIESLEATLTGYIGWDLLQLLSARHEADLGAVTGSCSMAFETVQNLQFISLGLIGLLLSMDAAGMHFDLVGKVFKR